MAEPDFPSTLGEFTSGGVVIVDRFPDREDEQVAFRTLIQLDGDVVLSIHAAALARPDFAELLAEHQRHVRAVLDLNGQRLHRLANGFGVAFGIVGVAGFGAGVGLGDITSFMQSLSVEWAFAAIGSVGGVLMVALRKTLAEVGLGYVLRRWGFARGRLRPP